MFKNKASIDNKRAMLARKEQILQDVQYYEKRIQELSTSMPKFYCSSSDSEDDTSFPAVLNTGPATSELVQREKLLKTCLQATQELTGVGLLQSEVTVMVQDPVIDGETPVTEPGIWREVTAECRIDHVPFSITFYTHQPAKRFAPTSYRGLRVLPVKTAQEAELNRSVLSGLTKPSDAVEVLRSYAVAYRSRRTTLARLADRYANNLCMEPLAEGGFVLKCANLMSVSWRLDNRRSAVAAFYHEMNFELEYMDESYLKTIKQAHKQLANPSLETDERTLILTKIISTCLEAQAQTQELSESMESDPESVRKREKTTLSDNIDQDNDNSLEKTDKEVMAPPKGIPRKSKPRGKENMDDNRKPVKRAGEADGQNAKKAKMDGVSDLVRQKDSVTDLVKQKDKMDGKNKVKNVKSNAKNDKEQTKQKNENVGIKDVISQKNNEKNNNQETEKVVAKEAVEGKQKGKSENTIKNKVKTVNQKTTETNVDKDIVEKNTDKPRKQKAAAKNVDKHKSSKSTENKQKGTHDSEKKQKSNDNIEEKQKVSENAEKKQKIGDKADKNNDKKPAKVQKHSKDTDKSEKQKSSDLEKAPEKTKANTPENTEKKTNKVEDKNAALKNIKNTKVPIENATSQVQNGEKDKNIKNNKVTKSDKTTKDSQAVGNSNSENAFLENNKPKTNMESQVKHSQNTQPTKTVSNRAKINNDNVKNTKNYKPTIKDKITNINDKPITNKDKITNKNDKPTTSKDKISNENDKPTIKDKINNKNDIPSANKDKITNDIENDKPTANKDSITNENKNEQTSNPNEKNAEKPNKATDITKTASKNFQQNTKNKMADGKVTKNAAKPKMVLQNHRRSTGGVKKTISKLVESKIPKKKLSPAYAAVLQQNPVRISPRVLSKFKSSSDTDVQSKPYKPVTNIPRLLKKPVPKSK